MNPDSRFQVTNDIAVRIAEAVYFNNASGQSQQIDSGNAEKALAQMAAIVGSGWSASLLHNSSGQVVVGFINPNGVRVGVGIRGTDQIVGDGIRNFTSGHLDFFSFQRRTSVRPVEVGKGTADWRAVTWFCICHAAFRARSVPLRGPIRRSGRPSFMPGMG